MSNELQLIPLFYLKVGGQPARRELAAAIQSITVESSLHLPDVATITLLDPELRWTDSDELEPGKEITVSAKVERTTGTVFSGEVVEIEPVLADGMRTLVVRAFDRLHRLSRGRTARRFVNITDGDLIKKIVGEVGLQAKVGPTPEVHPYVIQANESNLAFLQARAAALGYLLYVDEKTLHCEPPGARGQPVELSWGMDLAEFRPRMTTVGQLNEVTARGWDPKTRKEIVGQAKDSKVAPQVGVSKSGGAVAKSAFNLDAKYLIVDRPLRTQSSAEKLAQAIVDRHAGQFIEASGVCGGDPRVVAGAQVTLKNVGKRFGGTYFVTGATHIFGPGLYETHFTVSGLQPQTILSLLAPEQEISIPSGLVIGVVTDIDDPDKLGRVKLKFPWLSSDIVSDWARVVMVGGGAERGIAFLPEVNDEVLVGFELGDFNHPYVLGGLWNGQDKPPKAEKTAYLSSSGKVQQRVIRTRTGYEIRFDENSSGAQGYIQIKTAAGRIMTLSDTDKAIEVKTSSHTVKLDDQGRVLSLETQGDLKLSAQGKIMISGQTGVEVKSNTTMSLQANASLDLKSNGTASLQATAMLDVKSSAILNVQGTLVKIN